MANAVLRFIRTSPAKPTLLVKELERNSAVLLRKLPVIGDHKGGQNATTLGTNMTEVAQILGLSNMDQWLEPLPFAKGRSRAARAGECSPTSLVRHVRRHCDRCRPLGVGWGRAERRFPRK